MWSQLYSKSPSAIAVNSICALILIASLLAIFLPSAVEAEAYQVLEWSEVEKPGKTGNLVIPSSDISQIAVSTGNTVYALSRSNNKVYRSTNGGSTWTDITAGLASSAGTLPDGLSQVAVAPDKPAIVAFVADLGHSVYLSIDGGDNWYDTALPAINGEIRCMDISSGYIGYGSEDLAWSIAVGTAEWGNTSTMGQVWATSARSGISAWENLNVSVTADGSMTNAEISSIAFSPNYGDDGVILAVGSTASDVIPSSSTLLCIYQLDLEDAIKWNKFSGFPVLVASAGDSALVEQVISALALPSNYCGGNTSSMKLFLSYNRRSNPVDDTLNDVYCIDPAASPEIARLNAGTASGDSFANISSLSFNGNETSGKLLAGDYGTAAAFPYGSGWPYVQVRRCANPFDTSVSWQKAAQPPIGPGSAQVAWSGSGTQVYCGTGIIAEYAPPLPDESGFSRSSDGADTWEQVSLVDTFIQICDIAPTADSGTLFLATYNELGYEWVWRSAGEPLGEYWHRILGMDTVSDRIIIRLSPYYLSDYTLVAAEKGGEDAYAISHDRGNNWHEYAMPAQVSDIILTNQNTVLAALEEGQMRLTTNDGAIWRPPVMLQVNDVNMLSLASNGDIFVGSRDGRVSYSTDGAASFTQIDATIGRDGGGDVQVIPHSNYEQNKTIYAATDIADRGIYRWVIGSSTAWELVDLSMLELESGEQFSGLAMGQEGTLYALRKEPVNTAGSGGMNRSLNSAAVNTAGIEWDVINATLPVGVTFDPEINLYDHTPSFLRMSGNDFQNELWSVDTHDVNNIKIYRFIDNICKTGAWIDEAVEIGCDPASGRNQGFELIWEQLSLSDEYEINIAKDDVFSMTLATVEPASNPFYEPFSVVSPAYLIPAGASLDCGHGYYWRVRTRHAVTGEYIRSPWSDTGDFLVKAGFAVVSSSTGPQLLAPEAGCGCSCEAPLSFSWSPYKETEVYLFQLSESADMSSTVVSTYVSGTTAYQGLKGLSCNTVYFWRVMAVEPSPSEWSATFSFVTGEIKKMSLASTAETKPDMPVWSWVIIAFGIVIIVILLLLIMRRAYL